MLPQLHTIGRVAGKHGFHGDLVLHFEDESYAKAIEQGDFLFVVIDGKGVPFLIERYSPKSGIVKLADVDSTEQATELEGLPIQTENPVKEADSDSFDPDMLIGWELLNGDEQHVGTIAATEEYPAGTMLVVENNQKSFLIPVEPDWILELNEEDQYLILDFPEGLTEL